MTEFVDKTASLTPDAHHVLCNKATEAPHSGQYNVLISSGTYLCRRCGLALFRADSQFASGCGWPSFDGEIANSVKRESDSDGLRTEILCARCDGHLGHVFTGEGFTPKNLRHCVNALSLDFVKDLKVNDTSEAILAGGCFWGVEFFLQQVPGVLKVESGYTGGTTLTPGYDDVCQGNTGHYEAVRVIYDVDKTDYHIVLKRFFEIHDPTQADGQGPDIGPQYRSAVFYYNEEQKQQAQRLIQQLINNGYNVQTNVLEAQPFWPAEDYHQNYYNKTQNTPYCHKPVNRFD